MRIRITETQRILLLNESKVDDLITKYCDRLKKIDVPCDDDLKRILTHIDPTPTKKYLEWIIKKILLIDPEMIFHGADYVHDYMKRFDELLEKNQLEKRDINSYETYEDLQQTVLTAEEKKSKKDLSGQYNKIFEDDQYIMVRPLTEEASCRFGVDTKWCISSRMSNRFGQYTERDKNEFYFIIKKGEGRGTLNRVAVQISDFGRITLWNSEDRIENINLLSMYPDGISHFIMERSQSLRPRNCYNLNAIETIDLGRLGNFRLTNVNPNSEYLIATYVSEEQKDGTYILLKVTKEENNRAKFTLYYKINFEDNWVDSITLECNDHKKLIQTFEERVKAYENVLLKRIEKIKFKHKNKDLTFWDPLNRSSTYSFSRPERGLKLTKKFIDYVKEQNTKGEPATRKDFLMKNYGHAKPGFLTSFFSSIKNAGIVKMDINFNYSIGPNYEKYLQGKLRRD